MGRFGSGQGVVRDERAELERLRKENTALRMERDSAKSSGLVHETTAAKYAAIADWAEQKAYSVTFMCDQLGGCVSILPVALGRGPPPLQFQPARMTMQDTAAHAAPARCGRDSSIAAKKGTRTPENVNVEVREPGLLGGDTHRLLALRPSS
jgi:hypothetical protein